jgi:hypothetical protein
MVRLQQGEVLGHHLVQVFPREAGRLLRSLQAKHGSAVDQMDLPSTERAETHELRERHSGSFTKAPDTLAQRGERGQLKKAPKG